MFLTIRHFRAALSASVRQAFAVLGAKYHFRIPLDNPNEGGRTVPRSIGKNAWS